VCATCVHAVHDARAGYSGSGQYRARFVSECVTRRQLHYAYDRAWALRQGDATCAAACARSAALLQTIYHPKLLPIHLIALAASSGRHVAYSGGDLTLRLYDVNGVACSDAAASERLTDIRLSTDARCVRVRCHLCLVTGMSLLAA
jgi:hypothetical protein